jgi:hypothetical protein
VVRGWGGGLAGGGAGVQHKRERRAHGAPAVCGAGLRLRVREAGGGRRLPVPDACLAGSSGGLGSGQEVNLKFVGSLDFGADRPAGHFCRLGFGPLGSKFGIYAGYPR